MVNGRRGGLVIVMGLSIHDSTHQCKGDEAVEEEGWWDAAEGKT